MPERCGKSVNSLRTRQRTTSARLSPLSHKDQQRALGLVQNTVFSTNLSVRFPRIFPQQKLPNHLCLNTFFTQFPQHLLLAPSNEI
jgi:hypothetical protein